MNRLAARILILAATVAVTLGVTAVPASATTWTDAYIETISAPRCAGVPTASRDAHLAASICADDNKQLWTITPLSGGYYKVLNAGTGLCMANGGTLLGAPVIQDTCVVGAIWWQWKLMGSGNKYALQSRGAGLCIGPATGLPGAAVVLINCPSGTNWQIVF